MYVKIQIRLYFVICYLIMHIVHNMCQSPTSAALAVSCVFHIKLYFSRFETTLLSCTLFLESHLINTTSPHFQLPFIDIYYSLLLLLFYWNTAHKMVCNTANVFLKKFFQLNHIVNLLQVISKCIVNYIINGGCITAKTLRILCAVSRHVTIY